MPCLLLLFRLNLRKANSTLFENATGGTDRISPGQSHTLRVECGCPYTLAPDKASATAIKSRARRVSAVLLAIARLEDFELGELAGQHEIAVVHRQVAGDAVFVELERHAVDRQRVAGRCRR